MRNPRDPKQLTPRPPEARTETLTALAEQYVERHRAMENYILLIIAYLATGFGVLLPRLAMNRIVQLEKEREMAPLQRRLDHLSARLRELTEDEYEEMKRLKETHDIIRDSSETVLPISTIGQLVSSLILPTAAFAAAVAGQVYLESIFQRLLP